MQKKRRIGVLKLKYQIAPCQTKKKPLCFRSRQLYKSYVYIIRLHVKMIQFNLVYAISFLGLSAGVGFIRPSLTLMFSLVTYLLLLHRWFPICIDLYTPVHWQLIVICKSVYYTVLCSLLCPLSVNFVWIVKT